MNSQMDARIKGMVVADFICAGGAERCDTVSRMSQAGERRDFGLFGLLLAVILPCAAAQAQTPAPGSQAYPSPSPSPTPSLEQRFLRNILEDQAFFWSMPAHLRARDAKWVVPLGLSTTAFIATDKDSAGGLSNDRTRLRISRGISQLGAFYTTSAGAAAFYMAGRYVSDRRLRETGLLAFEATVDGLIVSEALKAISQRPRPLEDFGRGQFFTGGSSFPSGHAINSWAMAAVVAHEYKDSRGMQILSYGVASAVSISRFTARKHFISDVLVGSAIGYGIGTHVFHAHHDSGNPSVIRSKSKRSGLLVIPQFTREAKAVGLHLAWRF